MPLVRVLASTPGFDAERHEDQQTGTFTAEPVADFVAERAGHWVIVADRDSASLEAALRERGVDFEVEEVSVERRLRYRRPLR